MLQDAEALALAALYVAGVSLAFAGNRTALHVATGNVAWFGLLLQDALLALGACVALTLAALVAHKLRPATYEQVMGGQRDLGPATFFLAFAVVAGLWALGLPRGLGLTALLTMAWADPAGFHVGRRWGRHRLPNGKSLEGFGAVFAASLAVGALLLAALGGPLLLALPLAAGAALGELLAPRHGDNLLMTLGGLAGLAGAAFALAG